MFKKCKCDEYTEYDICAKCLIDKSNFLKYCIENRDAEILNYINKLNNQDYIYRMYENSKHKIYKYFIAMAILMKNNRNDLFKKIFYSNLIQCVKIIKKYIPMVTIYQIVKHNQLEYLKLFIKSGFNIECKKSEPASPLLKAIELGYIESFNLMLTKTNLVNSISYFNLADDSRNIVFFCIKCDRQEHLKILIQKNPNLLKSSKKDGKYGYNYLEYSLSKNKLECLKILIKYPYFSLMNLVELSKSPEAILILIKEINERIKIHDHIKKLNLKKSNIGQPNNNILKNFYECSYLERVDFFIPFVKSNSKKTLLNIKRKLLFKYSFEDESPDFMFYYKKNPYETLNYIRTYYTKEKYMTSLMIKKDHGIGDGILKSLITDLSDFFKKYFLGIVYEKYHIPYTINQLKTELKYKIEFIQFNKNVFSIDEFDLSEINPDVKIILLEFLSGYEIDNNVLKTFLIDNITFDEIKKIIYSYILYFKDFVPDKTLYNKIFEYYEEYHKYDELYDIEELKPKLNTNILKLLYMMLNPKKFYNKLCKNYGFLLYLSMICHPTDINISSVYYKILFKKNILISDIIDTATYKQLAEMNETDFKEYVNDYNINVLKIDQNIESVSVCDFCEHKDDYYKNIVKFFCKNDFLKKLVNGFYTLIKSKKQFFQFFETYNDFKILIFNGKYIDINEFLKIIYLSDKFYIGNSYNWFINYVKKLENEKLTKLLEFITGSKIYNPDSRIEIQVLNNQNIIPKSETCFNRIFIGNYKSEEEFIYKMDMIIEHPLGFENK